MGLGRFQRPTTKALCEIMAMSKFQNFVRENEVWFRGRLPETDDTLLRVENELGVMLPDDIKWLLKEYGYWHGTGISNIEESVDDTLSARQHLNLLHKYVVLYDHHDGGVILIDTEKCNGKNRVINSGWESVPDELEKEIIHSDFEAYTRIVIETEKQFLDSDEIECRD